VIPRTANNLKYGKANLLKLGSIDRIYYQEYYYIRVGYGRS